MFQTLMNQAKLDIVQGVFNPRYSTICKRVLETQNKTIQLSRKTRQNFLPAK